MSRSSLPFFFFFHDPATTEIYTLSLHDALPISAQSTGELGYLDPKTGATRMVRLGSGSSPHGVIVGPDRKSTRLNSSHSQISYAVFCLKKKKTRNRTNTRASCRGRYTDHLYKTT